MARIKSPDGYTVLVDDEDVEKMAGYGLKKLYVRCTKKIDGVTRSFPLHRLILGLEKVKKDEVVDHINGNPFDCRKQNLRVCSHRENMWNRRAENGRKYKGVGWVRSPSGRVRWMAYVTAKGKKWRKTFDSEYEAVKAYNRMAGKMQGKYARLNRWTGPSRKFRKEEMAPRKVAGEHKEGCGCKYCQSCRGFERSQGRAKKRRQL